MRPELELSDHLERHLPKPGAFDWLLNVDGVVHRQVKNRRTVDFDMGGRHYFIKIHRGCGWGEIFKNLLQARLPVLSAENEWQAIEHLRQLGIRTLTLAGKGLRGWNPARLESFVITEALEGMVSLEDLVRDWGGLDVTRRMPLRRALVERLAHLARRMHRGGLNHRDFYLCHFLVRNRFWPDWQPGEDLELHLIDLHRVQVRSRVPGRWVIKDLAGLLCSAFDWGVGRRDLALFVRAYSGWAWRDLSKGERRFWRLVWRRAWHLYRSYYQRMPPAL
jgi:heptose I phosphotransferase